MFNVDHLLIIMDPVADHQRALTRGARLAKQFGAHLELFVCDYDPALTDSPLLSKALQRKGREALLKNREQWLESHALALRDEGLGVTTDVVWGKPYYDEVTRKAIRSGTDLVVKATEFHSKIRRTLFTSSDWQLIRECPAPLWFTKLDDINERPHIVAAVDPLSSHAKPEYLNQDILDIAVSLQGSLNAELHIANWYALPLDAKASHQATVQRQKKQQEMIASLLQSYESIDPSNVHVEEDRDESCLLEIVRSVAAQIVVMGAISRSLLDRLALGSTAERLLDQLNCDVIIAKPHDFISPLKV